MNRRSLLKGVIATTAFTAFGGATAFLASQKQLWITPEYFGAVGNGLVDDTKALQAAIEFASRTGGVVYLKAGQTYLVNTSVIY